MIAVAWVAAARAPEAAMKVYGRTLNLKDDPATIRSYLDYHRRGWPEVVPTASSRAGAVSESAGRPARMSWHQRESRRSERQKAET